jgi:CheY-like chemotaxis protein
MASRTKLTDAETLELYRVALENAVNQEEIAALLAELGYETSVIDEGKALLANTRQAFDLNKTEDNETTKAYAAFTAKKDEIADIYAMHRKKAKVAFRNEPVLLKQLGLTGTLPKAYVKWVETMKAFYSGSDLIGQLQANLTRLKVTPTDLQAGLTAITELESLRTEYLKEVGESQDATEAKDKAFAKIDDWMSEFYAVAKIALEDKPQLLESLGKVVRS